MPRSGTSACSPQGEDRKPLHEKAKDTKCAIPDVQNGCAQTCRDRRPRLSAGEHCSPLQCSRDAAPFGGKTHKRGVRRSPPTNVCGMSHRSAGNRTNGASGGRPLQWYRAAAMFAGYRIVCGLPRHLAVNAQTRRGPSRMTRDPRPIKRLLTIILRAGASSPVTLRVPPSRDRRVAECRRARITLSVGEDSLHWGGGTAQAVGE